MLLGLLCGRNAHSPKVRLKQASPLRRDQRWETLVGRVAGTLVLPLVSESPGSCLVCGDGTPLRQNVHFLLPGQS